MTFDKHMREYNDRVKRLRDTYILRRDRLLDQIEQAFRHVTRGSGTTLHEAGVIDNYGTPQERAEARLLDTDTHWSQVDVISIDLGGASIGFLDEYGFRYYLPAYICATLRHGYSDIFDDFIDSNIYDHTVYQLTPRSDRDTNRFKILDAPQSRCVARFLVLDLMLDPYDSDPDSVRDSNSYEALSAYWKKFLSPSELKELRAMWPKVF